MHTQRGREMTDIDNLKIERITVRLSLESREWLRATAKTIGIREAELARILIEDQLTKRTLIDIWDLRRRA